MKTRDIRTLTAAERTTKLKEARTELMNERGVAAMGGAVRNPGKMRALRTTIARILTVQTSEHDERTKKEAGAARAKRAK